MKYSGMSTETTPLVRNTEIQGVGGARSKIEAVGPMVVKIEGVLLRVTEDDESR